MINRVVLNPKHEIRNPKQFRMTEIQMTQTEKNQLTKLHLFLSLEHSWFEFALRLGSLRSVLRVEDRAVSLSNRFEFRYSRFEFMEVICYFQNYFNPFPFWPVLLHHMARANVNTSTVRAPLANSSAAHASAVAPVV